MYLIKYDDYIMQTRAETFTVNILLFLTLDLIPPPSQVNVFVSVVMLAGKPVLWANWTSPQSRLPILQYEVQYRFAVVRSFQNNNWIPAPNVTGSPPPTSIHLKGLTPGHSYLVRVRAVSASGTARRWSSFDITGIRSEILVFDGVIY